MGKWKTNRNPVESSNSWESRKWEYRNDPCAMAGASTADMLPSLFTSSKSRFHSDKNTTKHTQHSLLEHTRARSLSWMQLRSRSLEAPRYTRVPKIARNSCEPFNRVHLQVLTLQRRDIPVATSGCVLIQVAAR